MCSTCLLMPGNQTKINLDLGNPTLCLRLSKSISSFCCIPKTQARQDMISTVCPHSRHTRTLKANDIQGLLTGTLLLEWGKVKAGSLPQFNRQVPAGGLLLCSQAGINDNVLQSFYLTWTLPTPLTPNRLEDRGTKKSFVRLSFK